MSNKLTLRLKRIDPVKWGLISGLMYAAIALIVVIPMFLFIGAIGGLESGTSELFAGLVGGGILMIFLPILYGVIGFILGLIIALVFNFILSKTNGLDMDFDKIGIDISGLDYLSKSDS